MQTYFKLFLAVGFLALMTVTGAGFALGDSFNQKTIKAAGAAAQPVTSAGAAVGGALNLQPAQAATGLEPIGPAQAGEPVPASGTGVLDRSTARRANVNVKKIYDGTRSYYEEENAGKVTARTPGVPNKKRLTKTAPETAVPCAHLSGDEKENCLRLQRASERQSKGQATMFNIQKKRDDTANGTAQNIK